MNREQQLEEAIKNFLSEIGYGEVDFVPMAEFCRRSSAGAKTLAKAIEPPFVPKVGQVCAVWDDGDNADSPYHASFLALNANNNFISAHEDCWFNYRPLTPQEKGE